MNQIRLSELLPGKALKWPEFFVRNIPNIRLESRVIPESQCFRYLHKKGILKVFTTVNQRVLGSSRAGWWGDMRSCYITRKDNIDLLVRNYNWSISQVDTTKGFAIFTEQNINLRGKKWPVFSSD